MSKVYLIAEVSGNIENYKDVYDSISIAKNCGADCVKFQQFTTKEMYGRSGLSETNFFLDIAKIKEKADAVGIDFMVSCFSAESLRAIDPYVKAHKIASSEITHPELLEAAVKTGKKIFLSTGASGLKMIEAALRLMRKAHPTGNPDIVLLYCNAAYPSRYHHLEIMNALRREFGLPVGLSDHSIDVINTPAIAAKYFDAYCIEKHFKLRDMPGSPDNGHSITSDEFKIMADFITGKREVDIPIHMPDEIDMILRYNRRMIAKIDIPKGTILQYGEFGNIGSFRSTKDDKNGWSATALFDSKPMYEWISGQTARQDIKQGDSIGPHNVVLSRDVK
jgi:N,N'-diacetyllegionaminate synthase